MSDGQIKALAAVLDVAADTGRALTPDVLRTAASAVRELGRAQAALTWIEQNVSSPVFVDGDEPDPRNGIALVARALSEVRS